MINITLQIVQKNSNSACIVRLVYTDTNHRSITRDLGYYLDNSSLEYAGVLAIKLALKAISRQFAATKIIIHCNTYIVDLLNVTPSSDKFASLQTEVRAILEHAKNVEFHACIDSGELAIILDQILDSKRPYDESDFEG